MTRIRIVGGVLNIITRNDHNILTTEGNITHNAQGRVIQVGLTDGVSYEKNNSQRKISIPPTVTLECKKIKAITVGVDYLVRLEVSGNSGQDLGSGYQLELIPSDSSITITPATVTIDRGQRFTIKIKSTKELNGVAIQAKVDGVPVNSIILNFKKSKDVFTKAEVDKLVAEIEYIAPLADTELPPEYDENYCMQAAERALSELFQNTKDFYAVERGTSIHKNRIGLSGLTAFNRASTFSSKGFISSKIVFNNYDIDHKKREEIVDNETYKNVSYDVVTISEENKKSFLKKFQDNISTKEPGFHVYYMTVTNGFHTLILVIDNLKPCEATYTIYDQHGITSSYGDLDDIGEGIARQTSWTFANSCLNRVKEGTESQWDSTKTTLWKIQKP